MSSTPCDSPITTAFSCKGSDDDDNDDDDNYNYNYSDGDGVLIQKKKKKRRESESKISNLSNDVVSPQREHDDDIVKKDIDQLLKPPAAASAVATASDHINIIMVEQQPEAAAATYKSKTASLVGGLSSTVDENDSGFITPTSIDQRIPEQRACPPPPRKPIQTLNSSLLPKANGKRKKNSIVSPSTTPSPNTTTPTLQLLLDFSSEVDSMFPASVRANFGCKIKKARSV